LKFKYTFLCVFFTAVTIIVNNPISTARFLLGTIFLSYLFISLNLKKITVKAKTCALLIILIIFIFPFADVFRKSYSFDRDFPSIEKLTETELTQNGDFDSVQQILNGVIYVDANGYSLGRQIIGAIFFWIPRSIWSGKPNSSGMVVADHIGYSYSNLSFPIWAEMYIDFGYIGVVLFFSIFGAITKLFESFYEFQIAETLIDNPFTAAIILLSSYQIFFLRGPLISTFAYFFPALLLLAIVSKKNSPNLGVLSEVH